MGDETYVLAGCKPWHPDLFGALRRDVPGDWHFAAGPADLTAERLASLDPRYVFFVHWSWLVPEEITDRFECVCFHLGDVPKGRGGSPVQNQIARGIRETKLTALRMTREIDAGPVYAKVPFSLEGGAEEIYLRLSRVALDLIRDIARDRPEPVPQEGEPEVFRRRKPAESRLPEDLPGQLELFDFIRMLDAEGYPRAFLEYGGFRFEFSRGALRHGRVEADVRITRIREEES